MWTIHDLVEARTRSSSREQYREKEPMVLKVRRTLLYVFYFLSCLHAEGVGLFCAPLPIGLDLVIQMVKCMSL